MKKSRKRTREKRKKERKEWQYAFQIEKLENY